MPGVFNSQIQLLPTTSHWSVLVYLLFHQHFLVLSDRALTQETEFHHVSLSPELCLQLAMLHSPALATCFKSQFKVEKYLSQTSCFQLQHGTLQ